MNQLTPRSKKDEIWREKERLETEARDASRRAAILERELEAARKELARLRERSEFSEKEKDDLRASNEKLDVLIKLTRDLASFDQEGVLKACVERIPYLVDARYASLYFYDPGKQLLTLKQHTHERAIDPLVDLSRAPASLMAQAVRAKSLLLIDDLAGWKRQDGTEPARPNKDRYKTRSCIIAPLIAGQEVIGVLNLADRHDQKPFDRNVDLELIRQAAELVAVSLKNAKLFEEAQHDSRTDSLTKLGNHKATMERLELESKRAKRYGHDLALVLLDLDRFALVNANHGHQAGDTVLEQSAKLVRSNVRDVDVCGRTGGDEFAVILPEQNLKGALVVADRLARIFKDQRFRMGETVLEVPATVGVVQLASGESASEALQRAKDAIAQARREGQGVGVKR
ncbi:diguanylate cyclase [bacterium]|nr:diguanylate cyclase [bacterium]